MATPRQSEKAQGTMTKRSTPAKNVRPGGTGTAESKRPATRPTTQSEMDRETSEGGPSGSSRRGGSGLESAEDVKEPNTRHGKAGGGALNGSESEATSEDVDEDEDLEDDDEDLDEDEDAEDTDAATEEVDDPEHTTEKGAAKSRRK